MSKHRPVERNKLAPVKKNRVTTKVFTGVSGAGGAGSGASKLEELRQRLAVSREHQLPSTPDFDENDSSGASTRLAVSNCGESRGDGLGSYTGSMGEFSRRVPSHDADHRSRDDLSSSAREERGPPAAITGPLRGSSRASTSIRSIEPRSNGAACPGDVTEGIEPALRDGAICSSGALARPQVETATLARCPYAGDVAKQ